MVAESKDLPAFPMLNVDVHALTVTNLNAIIETAIRKDAHLVIANHNLHSIYLCQYDASLRLYYKQASYIHVDGMPLIWIGKLLGHPLGAEHRVTYVDWLESLMCDALRNQWRIFYLGAKPGVAELGACKLRNRFKGLCIGTHHGHFDVSADSSENLAVLDEINDFCPNLLLVGMGMPRQEHWIHANRNRLNANIILPCGAAIDYVSGEVATPPRWLGRLGLEWLFRLAGQPRRLGSRYLVEPLFLIRPLVKNIWAHYRGNRLSVKFGAGTLNGRQEAS